MSVQKHSFENHSNVYHELGVETLESIYEELLYFKELAIENDAPMEHSLIIIDDFANDLKDKELCQKINKAIVKTRHLCCAWLFFTELCPIAKNNTKTAKLRNNF